MTNGWVKKRVLITVRTYPTPAHKGIEVSCTAGITSDGEWIRIFPVPYRFLDPDKRFTKYQWIDVDVTKPRGDQRSESYTLNIPSIRVGETVSTVDNWRQRRDLIFPLKRESLCQIMREREQDGPTLGIFKPAEIKRLVITPVSPQWTPEQQAILSQQLLGFEKMPKTQLEKIPFEFRYEFRCADSSCRGHRMLCTDWEMGQSYRSWRAEHASKWEAKFRHRYEAEMIQKNDTHFYVGTLHGHPKNWIIVGLYYPVRQKTGDLFDQG
jgi:hypothetical protein